MSGIYLRILIGVAACGFLTQCGPMSGGSGNMGGPTVEERNARISAEPGGDYYVGRRYYVEKTRFWGYLRKPGQPWKNAKLVIMREDRTHNPDRLSENGQAGQRYGYDNNYEYRVRGNFTGRNDYDPNSDQVLPEFMAGGFEVVDRQPGWLFRPDDRYDRIRITMTPR